MYLHRQSLRSHGYHSGAPLSTPASYRFIPNNLKNSPTNDREPRVANTDDTRCEIRRLRQLLAVETRVLRKNMLLLI